MRKFLLYEIDIVVSKMLHFTGMDTGVSTRLAATNSLAKNVGKMEKPSPIHAWPLRTLFVLSNSYKSRKSLMNQVTRLAIIHFVVHWQ